MNAVTIIDTNEKKKKKHNPISEDEQRANRLSLLTNILELVAFVFYAIFLEKIYVVKIPTRVYFNAICILSTMIALLAVSIIFYFIFKKNKALKYVLLILQSTAVISLNLIEPFGDFSFFILLSIIITFRYCDFKFTLRITIFALVFFFIMNFFATYFPIGFIDSRYHIFTPGFVVTDKTTYEEMLAHVDQLGSFVNSLFYNVLVPLACIILIVFVGAAISRANNRLVISRTKYVKEAALAKTELEVANKIQRDMLPENFLELNKDGRFKVYASMNPAKEVGGDFYDIFHIDQDHIAFLIADVSGKGVPASLFMAESKTLLKAYLLSGINIEDAVKKTNEELVYSNKSKYFVTLWCGLLNLKTGLLKYVDAGHNYFVRISKDGEFSFSKEKPQKFLAFFDNIVYKTCTITLKPSDRIFLYTDGALDISNKEGKQLGKKNLLNILDKYKSEAINDCLKKLEKEMNAFAAGAAQFDDITMMMLEYCTKE